jgi:hypothetical protein
MTIPVRFDTTLNSPQLQILPDASPSNDGVMTKAQAAKLASLNGVQFYDNIAALPAAADTPGGFAWVFSLNALFVSDGGAWNYTNGQLSISPSLDRFTASLAESPLSFDNVWPLFQIIPDHLQTGLTQYNLGFGNAQMFNSVSGAASIPFTGAPLYPASPTAASQLYDGTDPFQEALGVNVNSLTPFTFIWFFRPHALQTDAGGYCAVGNPNQFAGIDAGGHLKFVLGGVDTIVSPAATIAVETAYMVAVTYAPTETNQFSLYLNNKRIGSAAGLANTDTGFLVNVSSANMDMGPVGVRIGQALSLAQIAALYATSQRTPF